LSSYLQRFERFSGRKPVPLIHAAHDNTPDLPEDNWISIAEASRLLEVSAPTLRRWSDAGRVPSRKTLGGHRRFSRSAIEAFASGAAEMAALATIHPHVAAAAPLDRRELLSQDWRQRVSAEPGVARMRELGQRLLGLLLQHVHTRLNDDHYLAEAKSVGMTYGREAALAHISLSDTVKAFVYFRRACARLTAPASAETTETTRADLLEAVSLHERIDGFMDAVLLGVLGGFEGGAPEGRSVAP
jgi:excisionase family DNA binding protein